MQIAAAYEFYFSVCPKYKLNTYFLPAFTVVNQSIASPAAIIKILIN